jgi:hypothetical protein
MSSSSFIGQGGQGVVILLPCGQQVIKVSELWSEDLVLQAALEQKLGPMFADVPVMVTARDSFCVLTSPVNLLGTEFGARFDSPEQPRLILVQTMDFIEGMHFTKVFFLFFSCTTVSRLTRASDWPP